MVYCRVFGFLFKLFSKFHFDLVDLWVILKNELCNFKKLHGGIFLGLAFNFRLNCISVREHLHDFSRAVTAALPACREPCAPLAHAGGAPRVDRVTRAPLHVCALRISVLWNLLSFAVWSCRLILWIFERYICAWTHVHLALQVPHLSLCVVMFSLPCTGRLRLSWWFLTSVHSWDRVIKTSPHDRDYVWFSWWFCPFVQCLLFEAVLLCHISLKLCVFLWMGVWMVRNLLSLIPNNAFCFIDYCVSSVELRQFLSVSICTVYFSIPL